MSLSSGLIRGCSGAALGCKTEENKTFLHRFTDSLRKYTGENVYTDALCAYAIVSEA